jgi:hypothetical protein
MADDVSGSEEHLEIRPKSSTDVSVYFQPSLDAWRHAHPTDDGDPRWAEIARFDASSSTIHTYPIRTGPSFRLLHPKYDPLCEIAFEDFPIELPAAPGDVERCLRCLPPAFYTEPSFGLGVKARFRALVGVLRQNVFKRLVISRRQSTALDGDTLIVAEGDFRSIANELGTIADRFSRQSLKERSRHAHNELLWKLLPERFPRKEPPHRKKALATFIDEARRAGDSLSATDGGALLEHVAKDAPRIARNNPRQLYKLQRDFELAGLDELISRFEGDLTKTLSESHWQQLLRGNPFILSMLFGNPIVVVTDQAHVGGTTLDGSGETIVDFLVANSCTRSLALMEIKRPDTPLTGGKFREGRFKPSPDINGTVIQIIDQRYELLVNYNARTRQHGTAHAVDCVVVAGRTPPTNDALASFEMYRSSLRDVRILTFDEVLMKLRTLRDYLRPTPRTEPPRPYEDLF